MLSSHEAKKKQTSSKKKKEKRCNKEKEKKICGLEGKNMVKEKSVVHSTAGDF